jgi:hypothetical protein
MRPRRSRLFLLASVVLAAACPGGTASEDDEPPEAPALPGGDVSRAPAETASSGITGCQVLPKDTVERVLGVAVARATRSAPGCAWDTSDPRGGVTIDLVDARAARLTRGNATAVPDLGTEAFFSMSAPGTAILVAIDDTKDRAVMVGVMFPTGLPAQVTDVKVVASELARAALSAMPGSFTAPPAVPAAPAAPAAPAEPTAPE